MKKKLFCLLLILVLPISLMFVGCDNSDNSITLINNSSIGQNAEDQTEFVSVGGYSLGGLYTVNIIVNKATKVMYMIDSDGGITVMVNPDGTPMIYQGELN